MSEIRLGRYQQTLIPFFRPADALRSAVYVVGSPGMGKSTLLGNLCEQYCAAGAGVLLLDIKGDLARDIASRTQHPERIAYVQPGIIRFADGDRVRSPLRSVPHPSGSSLARRPPHPGDGQRQLPPFARHEGLMAGAGAADHPLLVAEVRTQSQPD